jgi:hypothetical protein
MEVIYAIRDNCDAFLAVEPFSEFMQTPTGRVEIEAFS